MDFFPPFQNNFQVTDFTSLGPGGGVWIISAAMLEANGKLAALLIDTHGLRRVFSFSLVNLQERQLASSLEKSSGLVLHNQTPGSLLDGQA